MTAWHRIRTGASRLSLVVAVLTALIGLKPALAAPALTSGTTVERVLKLDNKQVALPEGSWIVAADGANGWTDASLGSYGYLRTVILFKVAGDRVDTILEVNTNVLPTTDGWGTAADCSRKDIVLAVVRYRAGWDGSCYFVTHTVLQQASTPVWRTAREFAASKGWRISPISLTAGFRAADRSDVLDLRYHFAPETRGIATETTDQWQDSQWMVEKLPAEPKRRDFAHAVNDWAIAYSALVDVGLKNRPPPEAAVAMPQLVNAAPPDDLVARRQAELEMLLQTGAITQESYNQQTQLLREKGLGSSSTAPDLAAVTAVKAISYRLIVSTSHIFVDYYWTGSYVAAGALEILQITINSVKFYFHELAWAKYMGLPRGDAARTVDFKYIGVDV